MKKILIIQNKIPHYRKPLYNELSKYYHVYVLHSGEPSLCSQDKYKEIIFDSYKIMPFSIQLGVFSESRSNNYDVIIAMMDVRWLMSILSLYSHHKDSKFIWWGAWLTKNNYANKLRLHLTRKADASIFYTSKEKKVFVQNGINKETLFVANNTFFVEKRIKSYKNKEKKFILFVGSLNKRKGIDVLIKSFSSIINEIPSDIVLCLVGSGEEKYKLEQMVIKYNLEDRVLFEGEITDTKKLAGYYKLAIVSVSFGQAGLTVLQSLGHGVPFLTKENAISGGEKNNIVNDVNGVLCKDSANSLGNNLKALCTNISYARQLGRNAYNYYSKHCTIKNMVDGFVKAIK